MFIHDLGVRRFTWHYDRTCHRSNLPGEATLVQSFKVSHHPTEDMAEFIMVEMDQFTLVPV